MFIFISIKFVPFDYLISIIDRFYISDLILKLYVFSLFYMSYFPLMRTQKKSNFMQSWMKITYIFPYYVQNLNFVL